MRRISQVCAAMAALFLMSGKAQANQDFITKDAYLLYGSSLTAAGPVATGSTSSGYLAVSSITFFRTEVDAYLSAQTLVSSDTFANTSFTDGNASTGNLTVVSFTALSTATASMKITITSNSGAQGSQMSFAGTNIIEGNQWTYDATAASGTACSLAAALRRYSVLNTTCNINGATGIVYATAPVYGTAYNSYSIASSTQSAVTLGNLASSSTSAGWGIGQLSGGQDAATFTLNGVTFTAFGTTNGFSPITSTAVTATSVALAITNSSATTGVVAAAGAGAVVFTTATTVGTRTNYAVASSNSAALLLSVPSTVFVTSSTGFMAGGTNSATTPGSKVIGGLSSAYPTGLQVLYTTSTASVVLSPLVWGTTYYTINLSSTSIALSTSAATAVDGIGIPITSSSTQTTAHSWSLVPLVIAGTPSFQWMVSDDAVNWSAYTTTPFNVTITSATISAYSAAGTLNTWDFGHMDYAWFGLQVIPPTAGAISLKAKVVGKSQ